MLTTTVLEPIRAMDGLTGAATSSRPFGLIEAPTVYPSEHEFADPYLYITRLQSLGDKYGIVKVVPPANWKPPFCLDKRDFNFHTRKQHVGSIGVLTRTTQDWLRRLSRFHLMRGSFIDSRPAVGGVLLDYYSLKHVVAAMGGPEHVMKTNSWGAIAYSLLGQADPGTVHRLMNLYMLILAPFEDYIAAYLASGAAQANKDAEDDDESDEDDDNDSDSDDDHEVTRHERCSACSKRAQHRCGECRKYFHWNCVSFALGSPTPGQQWWCPSCIARPTTFLFEDGNEYNLEDYEEMANKFQKEYLYNHYPRDRRYDAKSVEEFTEQEFWRLVNDLDCKLEVEYGAEIRCDEKGSGFPMKRPFFKDPNTDTQEYVDHPWNLNNLPHIKQSLFRFLRSQISGVTVPWAYVGMTFSAFCWHTEDHYCYSLNYQHLGQPKTWYGIPASGASKFEEVSQMLVPETFAKQPDLLAQRSSLVPPELLLSNQVPVYVADQRPGEFIITFPNAYHAGFNHGFNVNEAVNYVPTEWIPMGTQALRQYRLTRHEPTFSHEELLMRAVRDEDNKERRKEILGHLSSIINHEKYLRLHMRKDRELSKLRTYSISLRVLENSLDTPGYRCSKCRSLPFFSRFVIRGEHVQYFCLECALSKSNKPYILAAKPRYEESFSDQALSELIRS